MSTDKESSVAGTDNRPPMLVESDYESWKIHIERYTLVTEGQGAAAVQVTRDKTDEEFTEIEKNRELANIQATNILSQGLPRYVFNILNQTRTGKEIWDNVELLMKGSRKSLQPKKEELFDEYERFRAIGNESMHDYFCKEKKRVKDSQYFKDKMLLMEAKEKGAVLDAEAEAFLADVECTAPYDQPFAIMTTNIFEVSHNDAYDSDVDEGPHIAVAFMANLSSTNGTNGATTSYVNEVHTNDNQIFNNMNHLLAHEMHQEEHLDSDVELDIDDNTISYHQYQLDRKVQDVLTGVSSVSPDAITSVRIQNDGFKVENVNLKRYQELSTCNLHSRDTITRKLTALTAKNAKLKSESLSKIHSKPIVPKKPKVLALGIPSNRPTQKTVVPQNKKPKIHVNLSTGVKPTTGASKPNHVDYRLNVKRTSFVSNSNTACNTCNESLVFPNHDNCVVGNLKSVNVKTPTEKHNVKTTKKVWEAKIVTVRSLWKPTGRCFTLYDEYPLTRIVEPIIDPLELTPRQSLVMVTINWETLSFPESTTLKDSATTYFQLDSFVMDDYKLLSDNILVTFATMTWLIYSKNSKHTGIWYFDGGGLKGFELENLSRRDDGKTTDVLLNKKSKTVNQEPQPKTDLEKSITKFLDGQRITNMCFKNNVNDMILKMKQNENNFQTKIKNRERKIDEWLKSQNISLEQTDRTDPPPPQAHTEHVNVVFTGSGKSDDSSKTQKEPPPPILINNKIKKDKPVKISKRGYHVVKTKEYSFHLPADEPVHPEPAPVILDQWEGDEEEELEGDEMDVDDDDVMDDPDVIHPYEEADLLNRPPPNSDFEHKAVATLVGCFMLVL
nr:hypothetical protein [Tanacetum cinerariifolium]